MCRRILVGATQTSLSAEVEIRHQWRAVMTGSAESDESPKVGTHQCSMPQSLQAP